MGVPSATTEQEPPALPTPAPAAKPSVFPLLLLDKASIFTAAVGNVFHNI